MNSSEAGMSKSDNSSWNQSKIPNTTTVTGILLWGFIHARTKTTIILLFLTPLFLLGVLANLLIIISICTRKALQIPKNILICELSIVDLGGLVTSSSYFFAMFAQKTFKPITLQTCLIQYYSLIVHSSLQIFTITIMAMDRYYIICHPFEYERKITNGVMIKMLSISWVFAAVYPLIYVLMFVGQKSCQLVHSCSFLCTASSMEDRLCSEDFSIYPKLYRLTMMAVHLAGSFSLVSYSYTRILKVLKHMSVCSRQLLTTVVTHSLVLGIFYVTLGLLLITGSLEIKDPAEENALSTLRAVLDIVYFTVPPTFNPIIYGLRNNDIRTFLIKFLRMEHMLAASFPVKKRRPKLHPI